jgi:hypothetical protein
MKLVSQPIDAALMIRVELPFNKDSDGVQNQNHRCNREDYYGSVNCTVDQVMYSESHFHESQREEKIAQHAQCSAQRSCSPS